MTKFPSRPLPSRRFNAPPEADWLVSFVWSVFLLAVVAFWSAIAYGLWQWL